MTVFLVGTLTEALAFSVFVGCLAGDGTIPFPAVSLLRYGFFLEDGEFMSVFCSALIAILLVGF